MLKLWSTQTGECITTLSKHTDAVTSCAWLPDGNRFVTGALDKSILLWGDKGADVIHRWTGARVTDLVVSRDGQKMVAVCHERKIRIYDLQDYSETG